MQKKSCENDFLPPMPENEPFTVQNGGNMSTDEAPMSAFVHEIHDKIFKKQVVKMPKKVQNKGKNIHKTRPFLKFFRAWC